MSTPELSAVTVPAPGRRTGEWRVAVRFLRGLALCALAMCVLSVSAWAKTFVVSTTADSGPGSLRDAITRADSHASPDTIDFQIGSGAQTISPTSALPTITEPVVIDGTTQPGFAGTPLIHLDGSIAGPSRSGLVITAEKSTVRGLAITGWTTGINSSAGGIELRAGGHNVIAANYIVGNGSSVTGSDSAGVLVDRGSSGDTIGGIVPSAANVISGNGGNGVSIAGGGTSDNVVEGNDIGTDASGAAPPNTGDGVSIFGGSMGNVVGGVGGRNEQVGNDVSDNRGDGVSIRNRGTGDNVVMGNRIAGNDVSGVGMSDGTTGNAIGEFNFTPHDNKGNGISGNGVDGVDIVGVGTTNNFVVDNGISANRRDGVTIAGGATNNGVETKNSIAGNRDGVVIAGSGTSGNIIAGPNFIDGNSDAGLVIRLGAMGNQVVGESGEPNVISDNGGDGVYITGRGTSKNVVEANYIGSDRCGCAAEPNGSSGVAMTGQATGNTIGGAGMPNVISGNSGAGVYIAGSGTSGNLVQRNLIGTTRFSDTALGNHGNGVTILDGATENTIGGTVAGELYNRIAYNAGYGVQIDGTATTGDAVLQDSILSNGGLGIALTDGGNADEPAPTVATVATSGTTTTITGSVSAQNPLVEVFDNPGCADPEGMRFLGAATITGGAWSLSVPKVPIGTGVTATATDTSTQNTSQFSNCTIDHRNSWSFCGSGSAG